MLIKIKQCNNQKIHNKNFYIFHLYMITEEFNFTLYDNIYVKNIYIYVYISFIGVFMTSNNYKQSCYIDVCLI